MLARRRDWWPRVWHMTARKRTGPGEAAAATRKLLDGLAGDGDLLDIAADLAALHQRYDTIPDEVFLRVAADALSWCGASRANPVPLEGLRHRFLADCSFRGRERNKLQYAVLAAAAISGGAEPDLLDEVAADRRLLAVRDVRGDRIPPPGRGPGGCPGEPGVPGDAGHRPDQPPGNRRR